MDLIAALSDLCSKNDQPIIAIDGPAGAGKTTLAANISMALSPHHSIQIFHMDDLYDGWEFALGDGLTRTLKELVSAHKANEPYRYRKYNWAENSFGDVQELESTNLLIFEGVGSGQMAIRDRLSALIWVEISPEAGLARVLHRDGDGIEAQMREWLIAQSEHFRINSTQEESEFILTN
jgi:uridine kinase